MTYLVLVKFPGQTTYQPLRYGFNAASPETFADRQDAVTLADAYNASGPMYAAEVVSLLDLCAKYEPAGTSVQS